MQNEVPTPGGIRTYWEVDYCLAMDFTEEDWRIFSAEMDRIVWQNFKDTEGDKNED